MSQLFIPSSPENDSTPPTQESSLSFVALTTHVSHLGETLAAITSVNSQALMIISDTGITFYTEYNHIVNAQLTIDLALFTTYTLSDGKSTQNTQNRELRLGIDAQLVSDSLAAAATTIIPRGRNGGRGTTTAATDSLVCYIKYSGEGTPLIIEFDDRLMSELIEFFTFYYEQDYPYDLGVTGEERSGELLVDRDLLQLEIILKSDLLANLLLDLQQLNTQVLNIYASNITRIAGRDTQTNQLNFVSKGVIGYLKLIYPNAKTMLEKMNIYERVDGSMTIADSALSSFNFLSFLRIMKAVRLSTRCKMMKDLNGVFSVQLLCKNVGIANYPGTLITFNMLERSYVVDDFGHANDTDINNLFDDDVYQQVMEYEPELEAINGNRQDLSKARNEVSSTEPFTYASLRKVHQPMPEGEPPLKERRVDNDDDNGHDFTTVGGAVEVPLFL